ncbi:CMGC/RCK protein kinase [Kwoniella heveanensis BCC8398]|uniref:CMGC/RCK protein kinase n=1 Tax=Kwoniella heveanensis BCC8398 TaxID=1296120 RepID=A0A1B9H300_9TREE|nr:CMGC/RCK protein kinase [Kwoniella heveanensis BCC8398]
MYQPSGYSHQQPDWHTSVAGPSSRRRQSPSPSSMASPIQLDGSSSMQARGSRGGLLAGDHEEYDDSRIGVEDPCSERRYTELKCLGDGSFGTVWLCDWHSPVKSDVLLSAMQCGAGARPEWAGKRLVALKRMKRVWEGGWKQAKTLGELVSLSKIPPHPAIIPLYDAFISPKSRELYFVFECMEGNLYQLTKSRRGRPLAAGLIASCFHQISAGLHHIHQYGYFHRDMKPENLLVTTTGLTDYLTAGALAHINNSRRAGQEHAPSSAESLKYEKDVAVIVKLADFGLARATISKPPYTEYVSTRWYRAPEVLLRSTEYGPPVDMWALGTILSEMLNLKPLFPGVSEIDQVYRICETMGDPSAEYGVDERGMTIGGGSWNSGIKLAKNVGFSFPKRQPVRFRTLFSESVPQSLVDCIAELLRYNPKHRMTAAQCIDHPYFHETLPHLHRTPPLPRIPFCQGQPAPGTLRTTPAEITTAPPRQVPPSHAHTPHEARPAFANGDMRTLPPPVGTPDSASPGGGSRVFFPGSHAHPPHAPGSQNNHRTYQAASALVNQLRELDLPTDDLASYGNRPPPSPGGHKESAYTLPPPPLPADTHARSQQWANEVALSARRPSGAQSTLYDGSVYEGGSQTALASSNPSFVNFSTPSVNEPTSHHSYPQAKPHVTAYVQQQQQQQQQPYMPPPQSHVPPPIEPTIGAARAEKLAATGKKKKWGLSSVFGGADKSAADLSSVSEGGYPGSSLKRTQSGNRPHDRIADPTVPVILDPKKAKKESERAAKEAEKAKREAAAALQKERARAVLQKRNQLIEARNQTHTKTEIEFSSSGVNDTPDAAPPDSSLRQPPVYASASTMLLSQGATASSRDLRGYAAGQASTSMASVRSNDSAHSGRSGRSGLSQAALKAYDETHGEGRHKARRRDDDDDHSMSSFGHRSLMSRSVLTVGTVNTVDSDPGPRRSARQEWPDPLRTRDARRAPSVSSFKQHNVMSRSNASLESQLAHDFRKHANVGAAPSSASLGRLGQGASSLSIHSQLDSPGYMSAHALSGGHGNGNGSVPTSPYGHPKASAVAHGVGMGRHPAASGSGTMLPSISSWEGSGVGSGHDHGSQSHINPMFRVPPAMSGQSTQQPTTLPPFSDMARVAGREGHDK